MEELINNIKKYDSNINSRTSVQMNEGLEIANILYKYCDDKLINLNNGFILLDIQKCIEMKIINNNIIDNDRIKMINKYLSKLNKVKKFAKLNMKLKIKILFDEKNNIYYPTVQIKKF